MQANHGNLVRDVCAKSTVKTANGCRRLISFDLADGDLAQHQPLLATQADTMCSADLLLALE